jgi:hypothetical protein
VPRTRASTGWFDGPALWCLVGRAHINRAMYVNRLISVAATAFVLVGLLASGVASAVPKPAPRFWSPARCERVLPQEQPKIGQIVCVGSGGPSSCRWTNGQRLYSQLTVFAWNRHANFSTLGMHTVKPGVVRSFTLATRPRPGFARIVHGGDEFAGWPAEFYMAHVRLLGTHVNKHAFGAFVAARAAKLEASEQAFACTGR